MSSTERALVAPAVEVVAKASRRRFTVEYKRKIVREADGCKTPGAVGALLPGTWHPTQSCTLGIPASGERSAV